MLSRPPDVSDEQVLATLRTHWDVEVDAVEHLPLGFGAWHWRADQRGRPTLFVTVETADGTRHDDTTLEATYAAVATLAFALDTAVAGLPTRDLRYTVPLDGPGARRLSVTPWVWGEPAGGGGPPASREDAEQTARTLRRLHAVTPPPGLRQWSPLVGADLADRLATSLGRPWTRGPHGPAAREALSVALDDVRAWTADYHRLAAAARERRWVPTHGEPYSRNQLRSPTGRLLLVDWESLLLAPAERDTRLLVESGHGDLLDPAADPEMLAMFDLEWRLDEVAQYAAWFAGPHGDGPDDRTALAGLRHALTAP